MTSSDKETSPPFPPVESSRDLTVTAPESPPLDAPDVTVDGRARPSRCCRAHRHGDVAALAASRCTAADVHVARVASTSHCSSSGAPRQSHHCFRRGQRARTAHRCSCSSRGPMVIVLGLPWCLTWRPPSSRWRRPLPRHPAHCDRTAPPVPAVGAAPVPMITSPLSPLVEAPVLRVMAPVTPPADVVEPGVLVPPLAV